jgi:MGT family glycosyltransferase
MSKNNKLHFLVLGIPSRGHTLPTFNLMKSLMQQECKVTYLNTKAFKESIETAGISFVDYNSPTLANISISITSMKPHEVAIELQKIFFRCALEIVPRIEKLHQENKYSAIIYDQMALWGQLFADRYNLPSFCSNTMFLFDHHDLMKQMPEFLNNLDADYNQKLSVLNRTFPNLKSYKDILDIQTAQKADYIITYYPESLHPPPHGFDKKRIIYLGNRFNSAPYQSQKNFTDTSLVYLSLGTVFNEKPELLKLLINYFARTSHKLLISTGANENMFNFLHKMNTYQNIEVHNFVNQLDILKKSSLFITHAGFNSMYEGLYCSVPMLMIPHAPEQHFNTRKIELLKAGYLLTEAHITEPCLDKVMRDVKINWQNMKMHSRAIQETFLNSNDNDAAASEIIRVCFHEFKN